MPRWTDEQWQAIEKSGSNILVSAGAGSGKTAVLSERVIHKIENGIHVNELLILTFTKAAASEMKDRIRKKIAKNPEMKEELNLLNSSYITTFDSFALSVVILVYPNSLNACNLVAFNSCVLLSLSSFFCSISLTNL
jgi:ATP-dependent helicase/nuclease subunit A